MSFNTLDNLDLNAKRVLIRADLNVPVDAGKVTDKTRIERLLPTIEAVQKAGGLPVLLSHFARPKGKRVPEMSLGFLAPVLAEMTGKKVHFADDCVGEAASSVIANAGEGDIVLLENTRFHAGEEKNDPAFAAEMALLGDIYVNDAFSAAHRAHASTEGIARLLPNAAGLNMAKELEALDKALSSPQRPVVAVVGGAKVSTKLDLIGNLIEKVDMIVIGGGMANTFMAAQGHDVGKSLCEHDLADTARTILAEAEKQNTRIILPVDCHVAEEFKAGAAFTVTGESDIPSDGMVLDAGPKSVEMINQAFDEAKTLIWNGPLGAFEIEPFDQATNLTAQHAAKLSKAGELVSVAGGGDTVAALNHAGAADDFTYISTAGGAFLEWMEGKTLPGVAALGG